MPGGGRQYLALRCIAFLAALVGLMAGCTEESDSKVIPQQTEKRVPRLGNANNREMPLDQYLLNPSQQDEVLSAYSKSIADCMRGYNFTYVVQHSSGSGAEQDSPKTRIDGRFGYQSITHAKSWGYHPTGGVPVTKNPLTVSQMSTEKWFALTGTRDESRDSGPGGITRGGKRVPSHGCVGNALLALTGSRNGVIGDAAVATDLKFKTLVEGQKDARTLRVFKLWSQCMQGYKYSYRSPLEALSDKRWGKSRLPSSMEIKVAVADQKCRSRHNVVGVWFTADFEAQENAVKANEVTLRQARMQLHRQVRAAQEILG